MYPRDLPRRVGDLCLCARRKAAAAEMIERQQENVQYAPAMVAPAAGFHPNMMQAPVILPAGAQLPIAMGAPSMASAMQPPGMSMAQWVSFQGGMQMMLPVQMMMMQPGMMMMQPGMPLMPQMLYQPKLYQPEHLSAPDHGPSSSERGEAKQAQFEALTPTPTPTPTSTPTPALTLTLSRPSSRPTSRPLSPA